MREKIMKLAIDDLQAYLKVLYGGRANEQSLFMKMTEELGEVAEVLNKRAGRKACQEEDLDQELGWELTDAIHYAVAIAAIHDIPLNDIIISKDKAASVKYGHDIDLESFLKSRTENG